MVTVSAWGKLGKFPHKQRVIPDRNQALSSIQGETNGLAFGMGRSYGDSCLNPEGTLWRTSALDHFIHFDPLTGRLLCEAGVLLRDIQKHLIPLGWALPVTPGTQFVTVGGAIANDVHGKNHHLCGSFGNHLLKITLLRTDGRTIECSPNQHSEWFTATIGGLGLTGFILMAELQLLPVSNSWIDTETIAYSSLDEFFRLSEESEENWAYTVSWIDCLSAQGRGLFIRGNHSTETQTEPQTKTKRFPFTPPISMVNQLTLRGFNTMYYSVTKKGKGLTHYIPFFYPLDSILDWNRMYGPKGFYQYQCAIPPANGKSAVKELLKAIALSGEGSFLAVLKTFGQVKSLGMLSFPMPGVTLALDFPNKGEATLSLFKKLDEIVKENGGRIYPAKDARMPRELFEAGYPNLSQFLSFRDPGISSAMSRRLMGY